MINIIIIIFDVLPSPNKSIKTGRKAIFGIGYIKYSRGEKSRLHVLFVPNKIPAGMPMASEMIIAVTTRSMLAPECVKSGKGMVTIYATVSSGEGTVCVFKTRYSASHTIMKLTNPISLLCVIYFIARLFMIATS
jgi:hypothetical protein